MRLLRLELAILVVACLMVANLGAAAAQVGDMDLTPQQQVDLVKELAKQGALMVLVLALGFFYRRDFLARLSHSQAQTAALLHVVQTNIQAETRTASQLERMARAVEALSGRRINDASLD